MAVQWVDVSGYRPDGTSGPMGAFFVLQPAALNLADDGAILYFPASTSRPMRGAIPLDGEPGRWYFFERCDGCSPLQDLFR